VGIPIYIDPRELGGINDEKPLMYEKIMKTPIVMDLEGVPLRRVLKLIAEQLEMGYGIKDGMVTMRPPDARFRNWEELMVMEESFPETSPIAMEVARARRGELTAAELEQLNDRLQAIDAVTKRYTSIRTFGRGALAPTPGGMSKGTPASPSNTNRPEQ
jgi:hypothetical protein